MGAFQARLNAPFIVSATNPCTRNFEIENVTSLKISDESTISVLMAVFNGAQYLEATLQSILDQSFRNFELVIVDDASSDETPEILRKVSRFDSRVAVLTNPRNLKLASSLNRGLEACRSEYIARSDADDLYHPDRLRIQLDFMERNPKVGVVSSAFHRIDSSGNHLRTTIPPSRNGEIKQALLFRNCILHPGAMFRKSTVMDVGGYDPDFDYAEDYDLWARLFDRTQFTQIREPLVSYRRHPQSIMNASRTVSKECSLHVSCRLLSGFLGRNVSAAEREALRCIYKGHPTLPVHSIRQTLSILPEVIARGKHSTDLAPFEPIFANGLLKQAASISRECPHLGFLLLRKAFSTFPKCIATRASMKAIAAILFLKAFQRIRRS